MPSGDDESRDRKRSRSYSSSSSLIGEYDRKHSHKKKDRTHDENSRDTRSRSSRDRKTKRSETRSSHDKKKPRKRKHRSKSRRRSRSNSYSSDDSRSEKRYEKKHIKHHKKHRKKHRKKEEKEPLEAKTESTQASFGKYGIVKDSDFHQTKTRRSFEIWLAEIKGVPQGSNLAKWESNDYFKEFAEDFNTATLPHMKYYDYDQWELAEYNKQKNDAESKVGAISDEFKHREKMRHLAQEKQRKELEQVRSNMNTAKVLEMKKQANLKSELINAYKIGDQEKRKQLQRRLEPDDPRGRC